MLDRPLLAGIGQAIDGELDVGQTLAEVPQHILGLLQLSLQFQDMLLLAGVTVLQAGPDFREIVVDPGIRNIVVAIIHGWFPPVAFVIHLCGGVSPIAVPDVGFQDGLSFRQVTRPLHR
jgi:hypothetical protein